MAHVFTTVSHITADEAEHLLKRKPGTHNIHIVMLLTRVDVVCARQHTMYHKSGWEQISTLWHDIGYKIFC